MFLVLCLLFAYTKPIATQTYEWAIVGAGLAGVTTLAVMLEYKIDPATIIWIDPEFNMGRLGKYYRNVPANTDIKQLQGYIKSCHAFTDCNSSARDYLLRQNPGDFLPLHVAIDPLLDATGYIRSKVTSHEDTLMELKSDENDWILVCQNRTIRAHKVILATGSHPKTLDYDLPSIPLDLALDKDKLATFIDQDDCIAVFGGMHSAMLVLKYLTEIGVKKIYNFYTTPYFRRIPGAESLEGITKQWVVNVLEKGIHPHLKRIKNTPENLDLYLPECNKVIYAIGFERDSIIIDGRTDWQHDDETGKIAPNLYGIGIAFAHMINQLGGLKVGINGFGIFSRYAWKLVPLWMKEK